MRCMKHMLNCHQNLKEIQNDLECATITITCSIIEESENLHSTIFIPFKLFTSIHKINILSWY